ncbi:unnamed protein product, partial [Rotaria sp. Silwood2]
MKTLCLRSTTVMITTSKALNLFDPHRRSTSVLKTLTTATTISATQSIEIYNIDQ